MNVYLDSLGCRLNRSEVEELAAQLAKAGHRVCTDPETADAIVVNTCAVTVRAERKTVRRLSALAGRNPRAPLAVMGCYATLAPSACAALPGVQWVVPNSRKRELPGALSGQEASGFAPWTARPPVGVAPGGRTRSSLKVQDGCNSRCTYCLASRLRGPPRSLPVSGAVARARAMVRAGCKEIVLTGLNLGSYGLDLRETHNLRGLVRALLDQTDLVRLRLSSVEPWDVDASFLELWADPRLCSQLHLPLQSGCDATLARMGRPISTSEFEGLARAARAAVPDMAITTDAIAGFPGESEQEFQESLGFVADMGFSGIHVFPFSPRPGTPAARLPSAVPWEVRLDRARRLREVGRASALRYQTRFVGRSMDVLWERQRGGGQWRGLTSNYLRVTTRSPEELHNQILPTMLLDAGRGQVAGVICSAGRSST
jgi:threonylcarbamoyladenosine tRNA methylthiotransferase MtaB